jgi:hypothetical protein
MRVMIADCQLPIADCQFDDCRLPGHLWVPQISFSINEQSAIGNRQ